MSHEAEFYSRPGEYSHRLSVPNLTGLGNVGHTLSLTRRMTISERPRPSSFETVAIAPVDPLPPFKIALRTSGQREEEDFAKGMSFT